MAATTTLRARRGPIMKCFMLHFHNDSDSEDINVQVSCACCDVVVKEAKIETLDGCTASNSSSSSEKKQQATLKETEKTDRDLSNFIERFTRNIQPDWALLLLWKILQVCRSNGPAWLSKPTCIFHRRVRKTYPSRKYC